MLLSDKTAYTDLLLQINNAIVYADFINHFPPAIFMSMHNVIIYIYIS